MRSTFIAKTISNSRNKISASGQVCQTEVNTNRTETQISLNTQVACQHSPTLSAVTTSDGQNGQRIEQNYQISPDLKHPFVRRSFLLEAVFTLTCSPISGKLDKENLSPVR